jgi:hypothetical protein
MVDEFYMPSLALIKALFHTGLAVRWRGAQRIKDTLSVFYLIRFAQL